MRQKKVSPSDNKEKESRIEQKYNFICSLYKITSSTLNLSQLFNLVMDVTLNGLKAEVGCIVLKDDSGSLYSNTVFGLSLDIIKNLKYNGKKLLDHIFKNPKPVLIRDYSGKPGIHGELYIKSILCSPLKRRKEVVGAIFFVNKNLNDKIENFDRSDMEFINIVVSNISSSIENAKLYEEVLNIKNFNANIINSISNSVITTDLNSNILSLNNSARFIFNLDTEKDYINKNIKSVIENLSNKALVLQALEKRENLLNLESILRLKDGSEKILNSSISILNNTNNEIIGFVISTDDITEKKALERQVLRNEQLAALGELSAGLAHEIKNPLTSIKGFSQILPAKLDDKEFLLKFSKIITTESERLNHIIESLLQFAKPKGNKLEDNSIEDIVKSVIELMEFQLKKNSIKLNIKSTPAPRVYCDHSQIEQVFINIILNAVQSMPKGGVLEIKNKLLVRRSPENLYLEYDAYYITDSGKGISEEMRSKIFNPFFTTKSKGTGLGLSITHQIISEHKGFIEVFSKVNEGSTFVIYFPTSNNWV